MSGNAYEQYLLDIQEKRAKNISRTFADADLTGINQCFSFLADIRKWTGEFEILRSNILVQKAVEECDTSIMFCTEGLYKDAFVTLREFLEHMSFSVYLSASDLNYRLWSIGEYDMSWHKLSDSETGVLGHTFVRAYDKEFEMGNLSLINATLTSTYRECSEYVHGNFQKIAGQDKLMEFDKLTVQKYLQLFSNVQFLIWAILFIRFKDEIRDNDILLHSLEPIIMENLNSWPEVQELYSGVTDS